MIGIPKPDMQGVIIAKPPEALEILHRTNVYPLIYTHIRMLEYMALHS